MGGVIRATRRCFRKPGNEMYHAHGSRVGGQLCYINIVIRQTPCFCLSTIHATCAGPITLTWKTAFFFFHH